MALRIVFSGSEIASRISASDTFTLTGTPLTKWRPFTSIVSGFSSAVADPICSLISSAVRSPMSSSCFLFK